MGKAHKSVLHYSKEQIESQISEISNGPTKANQYNRNGRYGNQCLANTSVSKTVPYVNPLENGIFRPLPPGGIPQMKMHCIMV
mmetsp:Transcript_23524/g.35729  ORF Transcript_23524/g.35729 Transcript_23524/m.35729 type:complete len:83 (-) Transcript_23524:324-572(-)